MRQYQGKTVIGTDGVVHVLRRADGKTLDVETGGSTVRSLLAEHDIELGEHDRVSPSPSTPRYANIFASRSQYAAGMSSFTFLAQTPAIRKNWATNR